MFYRSIISICIAGVYSLPMCNYHKEKLRHRQLMVFITH